MNNDNRKNFVAGLRRLADWIEVTTEFTTEFNLTINLFVYSKEKYAEAAKHFGACEKRFDGRYHSLVKAFSENVRIDLNIKQDYLCEKIVTKRIVPAMPEKVLPATPEHEVEDIQWKCPKSIMASAATQETDAVAIVRKLGQQLGTKFSA